MNRDWESIAKLVIVLCLLSFVCNVYVLHTASVLIVQQSNASVTCKQEANAARIEIDKLRTALQERNDNASTTLTGAIDNLRAALKSKQDMRVIDELFWKVELAKKGYCAK